MAAATAGRSSRWQWMVRVTLVTNRSSSSSNRSPRFSNKVQVVVEAQIEGSKEAEEEEEHRRTRGVARLRGEDSGW